MKTLSRCKPALGTYVKLHLAQETDDDSLLQLSEAVFAEIERIEAIMSFHRSESELSRVNRDAFRQPVVLSSEMNELLSFCAELYDRSGGTFDVTVGGDMVKRGALPGQNGFAEPRGRWDAVRLEAGRIFFGQPVLLDLGGVAKGYAVDKAMAVLPPDCQAVLNAGGDLKMRPWRHRTVGVREPSGGALHHLDMQAAALATSSAEFHEQGHPVTNPKSGRPLEDARVISVFASSCMVADALTKCAFLQEDTHHLTMMYDAECVCLGSP
ncbi:FAD:protein FMN transferase [Acanthopleuribacter pedis]|uniref:FAD:protein FMN transferase n=1 Tax=Acanthopleuribacter pedis TaxID=442870 RepID=A0A8J7U564_9BACT|nr:FAD:protein FMN transferase [Acanthopleuribacter pedis]MBO1318996.1 FAD:protein FMN transferase [Acanthopleuribacter pedis]